MSAGHLLRKKILIGLSGGVDSAVAALLLVKQGFRVIGATMSVYDGPPAPSRGGACYDCGEKEDIASAAILSAMLGIPHHVFDCSASYKAVVLSYFKKTYLAGKTPNPCVRCNHLLKFGLLPSLARECGLDFDFFATGHYARTEFSQHYGRHVLLRGRDPHKDQSYFLYRLNRSQINSALFPLGNMTKKEVRALAAGHGLPMHAKPDSQDFCAGGYAALLNMPDSPGKIVDSDGLELGTHAGFWHFTPGQRKGLGIAAKKPLYVLRVNPARNEVVAGDYEESLQQDCTLEYTRLHVPLETAGHSLAARLRSSQRPVTVTALPGAAASQLSISFAEPQQGVAAGQSLVLYCGDLVVGGGIIR
ncbi:tRNA 2-thiouridine(34) synthase MnmA [Candidatus Desulfovibrio trichonymphae]|uniref:tRNA-specific 2-thiouridylase MnmA n=1 Tax=Candidatus Desulfovibrio trichonymphae TaxID=1725232 RepID=A0A1J1DPJ8_9BACT|nr:tRNA 2-thiouridine(34) synthase MnmA [Candidatus Desulfovibrio trichonymphae]BAV91769.1 tRNA-specific 2-thiouridylase MnmA [Candidatus Desulfovibrio trichonymphae]GHU91439.1 tRNA-specific 2-thiouridylase MnmA [Deltaproteobacteria bacterium]GHU93916.1 tRNA-specific 2-thiouridylase MnmA [Deltaproteobacteria bacterium]